tara:strand:+ start:162 stop:758 length:597 start_codon:yes stop_codon:yes gene_type:complete
MTTTLAGELLRKLIHLFSIIVPLAYFFYIKDKILMTIILIILTLIALIVEYARRNQKNKIGYFFQKYIKSILRPNEKRGCFTGATWMLIGYTITVLTFENDVAVLALLFLSIGDSCAGIFGRIFPFGKVWNKSIFGSFVGLISCIIFGIVINTALPVEVIFFGAISGMFIEIIPLKIDDNFSIPIFSGFMMQVLKDTL